MPVTDTMLVPRASVAALMALLVVGALADPPVPGGVPPAPAAAAEQPIDRGASMRPAVLRDMPDISGKSVGQLPANTPVVLFERARLWVRVRPADAPQAPTAWASLLDFRFGGAPTAPPPPPRAGAPAAGGGAFAGFSRSVSSLLAGFSGRQNSYGGNTATIGIRGLTSQELGGAAPNYQAYADIERFAITPQDAQNYAFAGGLVPQRLTYLAPPVAAPAAPVGGAPSPTGAARPTPFR